MSQLNNKTAVITGASSGIGKAIAYKLAQNGVKVTLVARRKHLLDEIVADLQSSGLFAVAFVADMQHEQQILDMFKFSHKYWGQTDILINSAGVVKKANFESGDPQDWRLMWEVNVFAICLAMQESLKYFKAEIGGQIINISSLSAYRVVNSGSFYAATKFALRAITEAFRKELVEVQSKTRVSCISPGMVNTDFSGLPTTTANRICSEFLEAEDVANAALYILNNPSHVAVHDIMLRSYKQFD
jgi:NADP-dependent 3-hydroxy acid dehydrogenase YdfG